MADPVDPLIVIGVAALATTALALATSQAHGGTQTVGPKTSASGIGM